MEIYTIVTNLIKTYLIEIQLIFSPTKLMNIDNLITGNRQDIDLRIEFLKQVINGREKINKTRYYKFIQAFDERSYRLNPDIMSKNFISLYKNIKKNGFKGYFVVAKINRFNHMEIVFKNYRKISNKKIKFKYQVVGGSHRLAVCKLLGYKKVPIKIVQTPFLDFPDFTSFIKRYKI